MQHLKALEEREPLPDPERLGCYGLYGYGTGWGLPDGQNYCTACPARDLCANILQGHVEEFVLDRGLVQDRLGGGAVARNVQEGYAARLGHLRHINCRCMPDKGKGC